MVGRCAIARTNIETEIPKKKNGKSEPELRAVPLPGARIPMR